MRQSLELLAKPRSVQKANSYQLVCGTKEKPGIETHTVKMLRNDSYGLDFIIFYRVNGIREEARFIWDKKENWGRYEQKNPREQGTWFLETESNRPNYFTGLSRDEKGLGCMLILELVEPQE